MMEWVIISVLLAIGMMFTYRIGYIRGYRKGASMVLKEWKDAINMGDEPNE